MIAKGTTQSILSIGLLSLLSFCTSPTSVPLTEAEKRLPAHALDSMYVSDDVEVTLIAHEPELINPTNIDIDAKGRIWVCEGFNYRNHLNPNNPEKDEGDRILILEDSNGDGITDKRTVFYQGTDVNAALGISVLGDKVYVSCSPYMFVFTDENGDDIPDSKDTLFTAVEGVQHDHALHAVVFGPDGKLYFNYGNEGNKLLDKNGNPFYDRDGNKIENAGKPYLDGMVFRCEEDGSEVEILAHNFRNNYEVAIDSYGTLWQSDNDDDGNRAVRINYVMEHGNFGFKDALTGEGWRSYRTGMAEDIPIRHWHQNDPGVVPNLLQTGAGSPTGMIVYEGALLPKRYQNEMIHTDAGPRVVRAYPVQDQGAGYRASMDTLMYGAGDLWFRPADLCVAPDGSLIVADWYDPGVGGHKVGDLERGRLYRIAPPHSPYISPEQDYSTPQGATLALQSPNMATRYLAWKALDHMGKKAEKALLDLWTDPNPRFQARALWLLARLEGKTQEYIQKGLLSENPNLRITGLRIAKQLDEDHLLDYCTQLVGDSHPQVRREVALALRFEDSQEAAELWSQLAQAYPTGDRWYLEALGIGADRHPDTFFKTWLSDVGEAWKSAKNKDIVWRMRSTLAGEKIRDLITGEVEAQATHRYFRALDFQDTGAKRNVLFDLLQQKSHPQYAEIRTLALSHLSSKDVASSSTAKAALVEALPQVTDDQTFILLLQKHMNSIPKSYRSQNFERIKALILGEKDNNIKAQSIRFLLDQESGRKWLTEELQSGNPGDRQQVFYALSLSQSQESFQLLESLIHDSQYPLQGRIAAIQAYGVGWRGTRKLVNLLKEDRLDTVLVKPAATQLLQSWNADIRKVAATYLPSLEGKEAPLPPLEELVLKSGDQSQGKWVFEKNCSLCHQVGQEGVNFGPALTEIGNKLSKEALYSSILYPSAGISFGYEGYIVKTTDGNTYLGYMESEMESLITLRMQGGITQEIDREAIESIEALPASLMPEGLHQAMSQQELVDLVAYLGRLK